MTQGERRRANGVPMCGGTNRQGDPCGNTAGFRTKHPGWGNCAFHGGSTPTGEAHAAKLQAKGEAGRLGAEVPIDPADALTLAVRLVGGEVEFLRRKLREVEDQEAGAPDPSVLAGAFAAAVERLARIGKLASDAGIEERRLELDEALLDRLAGALRAALSEVELTDEQRDQLAGSMRRHLAGLDGIEWRRPVGALSA